MIARFLIPLAALVAALLVCFAGEPISAVPAPGDVEGTGIIEGRFVYDGTPPEAKLIDISRDETGHCKKGTDAEKTDPTWIVGKDSGVANVIVWVRAPQKEHFKLADKGKLAKSPVTIRQPHCAFEPHVFAMYTSYFDAENRKQEKIGQILKVVNDAPIPHNANVVFGNRKLNPLVVSQLGIPKAGAEIVVKEIKPCPDNTWGTEETIRLSCNVHPWMSAYGRVFDHPYFAITRGGDRTDKAFGSFQIKNVPLDKALDLVYWHESMKDPVVLRKVTLLKGKRCKIDDVRIHK
jgi:hypothetical protein